MSKYKIFNLTPDGWGFLLQIRDGFIYDGFGNKINLSITKNLFRFLTANELKTT